MSVAIVGTGFSGIGMAVQLLRDGVDDLVLFERSDDVGGVWRENDYPGAACDVPSHLYSFSFAREGGWTRRYAPQAEIHAYLRRVAAEHGVLPHVRFGTEVLAAAWQEGPGTWRLDLAGGQAHEADVLVAGCGQLSRPSRPRLPGLEDFAGPVFHSAEWDHGVELAGKRVAVVGTGASAIQFVPQIAPRVAALTVFQRSAPYVIRKGDRAYGPRTRALLQRVPAVLSADRARTYAQNELRSLGFNTEPRLMRAFELTWRRHLRKAVRDPELRRRLVPDDTIGCKRILVSNDWYPTLARPQVSLVTEHVAGVQAEGVVTSDGALHEADVLILGTGFAATELLAPMEVHGRGGRSLREAWADGAEAHLGTVVTGFPNMFLLYGPNTNLGHNSILLMLEGQFRYVLDAVRLLRRGVLRDLDVRPEVQRAYNAWLQQRLARTVFAQGCRSWYLTASGRNTQNWPGSTWDFRRRLRRVDLHDFQPARVPERVGASW